MQRLDVIALQQGLGDQFPVGVVGHFAVLEVGLSGGKVVPGTGHDLGVDVTLLLDVDNPPSLPGTEGHQAMGCLVDVGKGVLAGNTPQPAIQAIGPGMVRAGEGLAAAFAAGHLHAPVPAGVDEGAHDSLVVPHHQQRGARCGAGDETARLGQRRRGAKRNGRPAQQGDLGIEAGPAEIVTDRLAPQGIAQIGGAVVDMFEDAFDGAGIVEQTGFGLMTHSGPSGAGEYGGNCPCLGTATASLRVPRAFC